MPFVWCMDNTIEITREAFWAIIGDDQKALIRAKETELAFFEYYYSKGVKLMAVYNHVSAVWQYYVQDINA